MTWNGTENFDSYSTSADLAGGSGGTGWGSNWLDVGFSAGTITTETAPAGGQGGNAARHNTTSAEAYSRDLSATITQGIVSIRMRISMNTPNDFCGFNLRDSSDTGRMYVQFGSTGNIEIANNETYETLTGGASYSVDTWYTIDLEFDDSGQPDTYRARVNGGTWHSWVSVVGGSYTDIEKIRIEASDTSGHVMWWDDIKNGEGGGGGVFTVKGPFRTGF